MPFVSTSVVLLALYLSCLAAASDAQRTDAARQVPDASLPAYTASEWAQLMQTLRASAQGGDTTRSGTIKTRQQRKALVVPRSLAAAAASGGDSCTHRMHRDAPPGAGAFTWMSSEAVRQLAQVAIGNRARLSTAIGRFKKGENLTVAFIGGSITAGQGAVDGKAFPWWAEAAMHAAMGDKVNVKNGAVPGTLSSYMSVCHNVHMSKEADVIFVDYTLNDPHETHPIMENAVRRPFERLLRKLLTYPKRPAVILIHAYKWFHHENVGNYYSSSESQFHDFAMYYGLPELSVKAAAWNLMRTGVVGFIANQTRASHTGGSHPREIDAQLAGRVFYWDVVHPDGLTGHKFMGEISAQLVLDAFTGPEASAADLAAIHEPLPPPMLHNNWESASDKCFIGIAFKEAVIEPGVWQYKDEGSSARPKLGYISDQSNSIMKMMVNTSSSTGNKDMQVTMEVSYLKSYIKMGKAGFACISGCNCAPSQLDAHHADKTSLLHLHEFKVSQHDQCIMTVTVLPETSSGGHKIKIAGIMISEEGGSEGLKNNMAIDMVMEGMSSGNDAQKSFDMRTWVSAPLTEQLAKKDAAPAAG